MEKIKNLILEHKEGVTNNGDKSEQQALLYPAIAKTIAEEVERAERRLDAIVEFLNSDECSFLRHHIKKAKELTYRVSFDSAYLTKGGCFTATITYDFDQKIFVKGLVKNYKDNTRVYANMAYVVKNIIVPEYTGTTFRMERLLFSAQQYIKEVDYGVFNWIEKMVGDINSSISRTLEAQSELLNFVKGKGVAPVKVKKYVITITETEDQI